MDMEDMVGVVMAILEEIVTAEESTIGTVSISTVTSMMVVNSRKMSAVRAELDIISRRHITAVKTF